MLRMFYPKKLANSAYEIDYQKLYKEGYRGLLFDIDNTLVEHGAEASQRAKDLFKMLKQIGFQACLISNNQEARVKKFNEDIQVHYIYKANKPLKKSYIDATKLMGTRIKTTVFIGDQLFTDVLGANRIGMMTYLVNPIGPKEEIQIVIKRYFERIVLYFYRRDIRKMRERKQREQMR